VPTAHVSAVPTLLPSATPKPVGTLKPAVTAPPLPSYARTPGPSLNAAAPGVHAASAPPVRPVASTADTAIGVARSYLESLIAGDDAGAAKQLSGGSDLKEAAFLDKDARITSLRASRSDASGATVDAEITTGRGSYVATFRVVNGVITQHDYIKI
jgi:hypothetical protein